MGGTAPYQALSKALCTLSLQLCKVALLMPLIPAEWVSQTMFKIMASGPECLPSHLCLAPHHGSSLGQVLQCLRVSVSSPILWRLIVAIHWVLVRII